MTPSQWLKHNRRNFSLEMNGYPEPPIDKYNAILTLMDRGGKILDIGCGNGMLLKFLITFSDHKLIPYGIDKEVKAIEAAKKDILPEFADNFRLSILSEYAFLGKPFDMIITNPLYMPTRDRRMHTSTFLENITNTGKLIYRAHKKDLQEFGSGDGMGFEDLINIGLNISTTSGIVFWVIDKAIKTHSVHGSIRKKGLNSQLTCLR